MDRQDNPPIDYKEFEDAQANNEVITSYVGIDGVTIEPGRMKNHVDAIIALDYLQTEIIQLSESIQNQETARLLDILSDDIGHILSKWVEF